MNIRVLREAGGLGDVVRILPALAGLRERYPDAWIDCFVPADYAPLIERAGAASRLLPAPQEDPARRPRLAVPDPEKYPYLRGDRPYDLTVDLYCPAFAFELRHGRLTSRDRIELFCEAAGVAPRRPALPVTPEECQSARADLLRRGIAERRGWVPIQAHSTDGGRDWPRERWLHLAARLHAAGYSPYMVDIVPHRQPPPPVPQVTNLNYLQLAAFLRVSSLFIGPDSGPAHLAGAVGAHAMGVVASQSGAVLYRHYPTHSYVQPDRYEGCQWPCIWPRPPGCGWNDFRSEGRTCAALAAIETETVLCAALELLATRLAPREREVHFREGSDLAAPEIGRLALEHIPYGQRLIDVEGFAGDAMARAGIVHHRQVLSAYSIPLPLGDRSERYAVLGSWPTLAHVSDWLWELFRVLHVGGLLHARPHLDAPLLAMGFERVAGNLWRKGATWPKAGRP